MSHPLKKGTPLKKSGANTKGLISNAVKTQPVRPAGLIMVFGYWNNRLAHHFQAISYPNPPTITGGWGNVANVTRPRSRDYVMVTDYPPITMDVGLRFDNWINWHPSINPDLEADMSKLQWMWHRGKIGPGQQGVGNPPVLKLAAYNGTKHEIPLIPPDVQDLEWIISNVSYDTSPLRFSTEQIQARQIQAPVGTRARQDVVISLTQWNPPAGFRTPRAKIQKGVVYERTTPGHNTIVSMCQNLFDRHKQVDYKDVLRLSANKHLHLRSATQKIPNGKRVAFPARFANSGN